MTRLLFAATAPILGFGFWGVVDFHRQKYGELLRLAQELTLTGLAVAAFYSTEAHVTAWLLAILSIAHHILVYVTGDRLLKAHN